MRNIIIAFFSLASTAAAIAQPPVTWSMDFPREDGWAMATGYKGKGYILFHYIRPGEITATYAGLGRYKIWVRTELFVVKDSSDSPEEIIAAERSAQAALAASLKNEGETTKGFEDFEYQLALIEFYTKDNQYEVLEVHDYSSTRELHRPPKNFGVKEILPQSKEEHLLYFVKQFIAKKR